MGDHTADFAVERAYMRVLHEIDKAMIVGDMDRAQAMVKRGALGNPKVLAAHNPQTSCNNP